MALMDTYRNMVIDRVQKAVGFDLQQGSIPARQWKRISDLSDILHETIILEQMIRVEERKGRSLSSRLSSKIRKSKGEELAQSLAALEAVKARIWKKCESLAYDIIRDREIFDGDDTPTAPTRKNEMLRCRNCGESVSILEYNNFKCSGCGLGYSAKDYLELLMRDVEKV